MMEVDKEELQTMLREFWSINNPLCEAITVMFLRKSGLSDKEILFWLNLEKLPDINNNDRREYNDKLKDTKDYFIMK